MSDSAHNDNRHGQTPLGGRRKEARRAAIARQWSGYVAMIRICPRCGFRNVERNIFCGQCAHPIDDVAPSPADSDDAGRELLRYRLATEARTARRNRVQVAQGGSGSLILGMIFIFIGAWISVDVAWQFGLWGVGMALAIYGLWKLRTDATALRNWGVILAACSVTLVALFANNSIANGTDDDEEPTTQPTVVSSPAATPVGGELADMPQYQGDIRHTGLQPGPAPVDQPTLAWRFDTGGEIYSSPVVADQRLFVASKSGILYALDATSGTELWRFELSDYVVRSTPAVANGTVYIGAGFNLFALDAATGAERWRLPLAYAGQSTPLVMGNDVFVASQEGWVYRVNATTGAQEWRIDTDGLPFGAIVSDGTAIYVATDTGIVISLNAETGRNNWRRDLATTLFAAPAISGSHLILVSQNGSTTALDLTRGTVVWSATLGGTEPPALTDVTGYLAAADGAVTAFDLATGATGWVYPTGRTAGTAPVLAGDWIITGAGRNLTALNSADGMVAWSYIAGDTITTPATVTGGMIFFGGADGFVYAVAGA